VKSLSTGEKVHLRVKKSICGRKSSSTGEKVYLPVKKFFHNVNTGFRAIIFLY
jgi:hypothetical protein